jgi:hypothetical protein
MRSVEAIIDNLHYRKAQELWEKLDVIFVKEKRLQERCNCFVPLSIIYYSYTRQIIKLAN